METSYKEKLKYIEAFIFDVDGVFTDGSLLITSEGQMLRKMNVKDGYAVKTAVQKGYPICIITGGSDEGVRMRLEGLGITNIYLSAHLKEAPFKEFLDQEKINPKNVLYMGDDMPDIPPMKIAGLATCPQDAIPEVKAISKYISHRIGGDGCVRDVIEQVLKVRGDWNGNFSASND